eukprot:gene4936-6019_t
MTNPISDAGLSAVIACWIGGFVLPIYAPYAAIVDKNYAVAALYAFLSALKALPRDVSLMAPFRYAYKKVFEVHFPDVEFINPTVLENPIENKRQIGIVGPHGMFSFALMRIVPAASNIALFVDNNLATYNPIVTFLAKCSGIKGVSDCWNLPSHFCFEFLVRFLNLVTTAELKGLKNDVVTGIMRKGELDGMVVAGGFEEASVGTYTTNRICHQTWLYWIRQCLRHEYGEYE